MRSVSANSRCSTTARPRTSCRSRARRVLARWNDVLPRILRPPRAEPTGSKAGRRDVRFFSEQPDRARLSCARCSTDRAVRAQIATTSPRVDLVVTYIRRVSAKAPCSPDVDPKHTSSRHPNRRGRCRDRGLLGAADAAGTPGTSRAKWRDRRSPRVSSYQTRPPTWANFLTTIPISIFYSIAAIDWERAGRADRARLPPARRLRDTEEAVELLPRRPRDGRRASSPTRWPRRRPRSTPGRALEDGEAVVPRRDWTGCSARSRARAPRHVPAARARAAWTPAASLYWSCAELIARADVSIMAHHGFHGGDRDGDAASLDDGGHRPRSIRDTGRSCATRLPGRDRRDRAGRRVGLHGHHRARRRQRHGRAAQPSAEQDAGRQLVRDRAEDLHHVGPRQVPLRHRPHREADDRRSDERAEGPVDVPGARLPRTCPTARARRFVTVDRIEEKLGHHGSVDRRADLRSRAGRAGRQARRRLQATC